MLRLEVMEELVFFCHGSLWQLEECSCLQNADYELSQGPVTSKPQCGAAFIGIG